VRELVLDASVVLKWFRTEGERHVNEARALRADFEAGRAFAFVPRLLFTEIINVAGRRWRFEAARLEKVAATLPNLGFEVVDTDLRLVARWTASGLTAYDATYVAVAEHTGAVLVTDDEEIARAAPQLTISLGPASS
jgi:predicted nucleic acid-binding protein